MCIYNKKTNICGTTWYFSSHIFKKLQIILTDLPNHLDYIIKKSNLRYEGSCNYCFDSNMFDDYFLNVIEAHIPIYCSRASQDEYLVIIPIKYNLNDIFTTIKTNNKNDSDNDNDN